jgi:hypothetical protein
VIHARARAVNQDAEDLDQWAATSLLVRDCHPKDLAYRVEEGGGGVTHVGGGQAKEVVEVMGALEAK